MRKEMKQLQTKNFYEFDDFRVDPVSRLLFRQDEIIPLTAKVFDILLVFVDNCGRVLEKDELMQRVWAGSFVEEGNLTRNVSTLRKALSDDPKSHHYIVTVPGHGYKFVADVKRTQASDLQSIRAEQTVATTDSKEEFSLPSKQLLLHPDEVKANLTLRRLKLSVVAIVLVGVALSAFLIWRINTKSVPTATSVPIKITQVTTWPGLDFFPALSPDGNSIAYSSDHNGNFEIYIKQLTPGSRDVQITADGAQNFQPAWSPDGKFIAYYSYNRGIWVVPALGGSARQLTEFGSYPVWSPDGSTIAFQSQQRFNVAEGQSFDLSPSTIYIVSLQGGAPTPITQAGNPQGVHGCPLWSPDGKRILFVACNQFQGSLWSVTATGNDLKQVVSGISPIFDPIYSHDGQSIYFGSSQEVNFGLSKIRISPGTGEAFGQPEQILSTGTKMIRHLALSADDKKLAYSVVSTTFRLSTLPISPESSESSGPPVPLIQDTSFGSGFPVFSPDGRKIAFLQWVVGSVGHIWMMDADGKNQTQLTLDPDNHYCQSWLPGGDKIAFLSYRGNENVLSSIDVKSGREEPLFIVKQNIAFARLSPDGKQFAFNSTKDGTINIWTVPVEGGQPQQLTFDKELMGWPCWSPDGKFLAFEMTRGANTHIALIPSAGGTVIQLTFENGQSWPYSWSPDGDKIAFARLQNGYWNLWWVSRSTKVQKQVSNYKKLTTFVRYPAWSPLGNQVVYEYGETTGNIWIVELK